MDEFNPAYGMAKAAFDKFGGKAAEKPAETFALIYDHVFDPFHYKMKKVKFDRELNFQKYQDEVLGEMEKIPENQFNEPSLSIVGPAIEASKYYINDDDIRSMFAKLLARSMHKGYSDIINHSFVEILKQLSPVDAKFLRFILKRKYIATAKIVATFDNYEGIPLTDYHFVDYDHSVESISLSLNNLKRLGLIELPEYNPLFPDLVYKEFYISDTYKDLELENEYKRLSIEFNDALKLYGNDLYSIALDNSVGIQEVERFKKYSGIELIKTNTSLSSYGKALAEVCLTD